MAIPLKQSTASQEVPLGHFLDSTDGNTEETGLTIANTDIKLWKAGATTLANKNSGGATHISNGIYYAVLDGTDTDTLGPLVIFVHVSGALAVKVECLVLAANAYDSLIAASDKLQVDAVEVSSDSAAADNAELFFDGTGYNAANSTIGTATNVTTVNGLAAGVITATAIAANAITSAKIATGALTSAAFAAGAIASGVIASAELDNIADAFLKRDWTAVTGEAARSVLNALRFLRNKWSISGSTLTVTKEDDSTSAWTAAITTTSGANPVTASDPT